jgi:hypothetical protein
MVPKNKVLSEFASDKNITIIDWSSIGVPYLDGSGVHPDSSGQSALADLIANKMGKYSGN